MKDNSFIITKAMKAFLLASIMSGMVAQVSIIMDGIIVSHFVDTNALSAINLYEPLAAFVECAIVALTGGTTILASRKLGEHDYDWVSGIYSTTMVFSLVVVAVLTAVVYAFLPQMVSWSCSDPLLSGYLYDYAAISVFGNLTLTILAIVYTFIGIDGHPQYVTFSIVVQCVVNIVFDILFVKVLGTGISGSAIATQLSYVAGLLVTLPYFFRQGRSFHFAWKMTGTYPIIKDNLRIGIPMSAIQLVFSISVFFLNTTVLASLGQKGAYVLAIVMQLLMLILIVVDGFGQVIRSVGSVFVGEGDNISLRLLVGKTMRWMMVLFIFVSSGLIMFPEYVVMLFGADNNLLIEEVACSVRIAMFMIIPYVLIMFMVDVYMVEDRVALSTAVNMSPFIVMALGMIATIRMAPDYAWYSLPVGMWLLLAGEMLVAYIIYRRNRCVSPFTLLPVIPDDVSVKLVMDYSNESVAEGLRQIKLFLETTETDLAQSKRITLICEELMYNIVNHGKTKNIAHHPELSTFELNMRDKDDTLLVCIKDGGCPFNPVQKTATVQESETPSPMQFGLQIVNSLCRDMDYKYMYGLNVTVMGFSKRLSPQAS